MRTFSILGCFLASFLWATAMRAAAPDVGVTVSHFNQADKDRNKSLNPDEAKVAVDKWKTYLRGKLGGNNLKAVEGRLGNLNPDADGNGTVTRDELLKFASDSLGIPVPGVAPPIQFPPAGGNDKEKKDDDKKKDGDKKKDDDRRPPVQTQPRAMPQRQPQRDDRDRTPSKGFSRGAGSNGNSDRRPSSANGNSSRTPPSSGGNSNRTPPSGGNSRIPGK